MANIADLLLPLLRISSRRTLRREWKAPVVGPTDQVAIFAHFDPDGRIASWLLRYLEEVKSQGFRVLLVSTSPSLDEGDVARALTICTNVLLRRNVGLDFSSWKLALDQLDVPVSGLRSLLLANDSVYGPFQPLDEIFQRLRENPADVVGLTDSQEIAPHLQSYFVYYKAAALRAPWFAAFWRDVSPLKDKNEIIRRYEVGLGEVIQRGGSTYAALFPYAELANTYARSGLTLPPTPQNPTLRMWEVLLGSRYPFVKGELLRRNPLRLPGVDQWDRLVPQGRAELLNEVKLYLQRLTKRAPVG